jgi:RNA polymerase sigma-70 factor, ECF subfamily
MRFGPSNGHTPLTIDLREYLDGLYSYALVLSRNQAEAEDLVQETCLRALRAMERLRPDSNVKSWLFTILRNIWLNQLRQRKTAPDVVDLDSDEYGEQLPLESREIILLREYEELSYEEIAAMLQCPVGTVMSRLARARSKLRDLLAATTVVPSGTKADDAKDSRRGIKQRR